MREHILKRAGGCHGSLYADHIHPFNAAPRKNVTVRS